MNLLEKACLQVKEAWDKHYVDGLPNPDRPLLKPDFAVLSPKIREIIVPEEEYKKHIQALQAILPEGKETTSVVMDEAVLLFNELEAKDDKWVTVNGKHVLLDGEGNVVQGVSKEAQGKPLGAAFGSFSSDSFAKKHKLSTSDFSGVEGGLQSKIIVTLDKLLDNYQSKLERISTYKKQGGEGAVVDSERSLRLNISVFGNEKSLERHYMLSKPFQLLPSSRRKEGVGPAEVMVTHEFAHTLFSAPFSDFWGEKVESKEFAEKLKKLYGGYKYQLSKIKTNSEYREVYLSEYASTDLDEFFAEAFTQAQLSKEPSVFALKVQQLVDEYFGKERKSAQDDKWITTKPKEGKGKHILLDDEGNVKGGLPKEAQGKSLTEAFSTLSHTTARTAAENSKLDISSEMDKLRKRFEMVSEKKPTAEPYDYFSQMREYDAPSPVDYGFGPDINKIIHRARKERSDTPTSHHIGTTELRNYFKEQGVPEEAFDQMRDLFFHHAGGSEEQQRADDAMIEHIKRNDDVGKALLLNTKIETFMANEENSLLRGQRIREQEEHIRTNYIDSYEPNLPYFTEPLRLYRKGKPRGPIVCFTTDPEGANTGTTRMTPTYNASWESLQKQGYSVLGGISRMMGRSGEAEVTLIKLGDIITHPAKDEKWITTKPKEGKGKHILLDDEGNVKGGLPNSAQGKPLKEAFTELSQKVKAKKEKPVSAQGQEPNDVEQYIEKTFADYGLTAQGEKPQTAAPAQQAPQQMLSPEKITEMTDKLKEVMLGGVARNPSNITQDEREEAKSRIADSLGDSLIKNKDFCSYLVSHPGTPYYQTPLENLSTYSTTQEASKMVKGWAQTSADHDPKAILMQRCAQELFGLGSADTSHFPAYTDKQKIAEFRIGVEAAKGALENWDSSEKGKRLAELVAMNLKDYRSLSKEQVLDMTVLRKERSGLADAVGDAIHAVNEATKEGIEDLYNDHTSAGYKAFLQEQYNQTQKYLKEKGITHVRVYRGMEKTTASDLKQYGDLKRLDEEQERLHGEYQAAIPMLSWDPFEQSEEQSNESEVAVRKERYSKALQDFLLEKERAEELRAEALKKAQFKLQPISSFSTDYKTARDFAGSSSSAVVLTAIVPVEHILSTARTGFGCLSEAEVTVLAHDLNGSALAHSGGFPKTEKEYLEKLGVTISVKDQKIALDEKWVTIKKSEEGKGRKLLLNDDGTIKGGAVPKTMQGKPLKQAFEELKQSQSKKQNKKEEAVSAQGSKVDKPDDVEQYITKTLEGYGITPEKKVPEFKAITSPTPEPFPLSNDSVVEMTNRLKEVMLGGVARDPQHIPQEERSKAKEALVESLTDSLLQNDAFMDFFGSAAGTGLVAENLRFLQKAPVLAKVSSLIHGWAETSADNNPKALLMQRCAQEVFGLKDVDTSHFPAKVSAEELEEAGEILKKALDARVFFERDYKDVINSLEYSDPRHKELVTKREQLLDEYMAAEFNYKRVKKGYEVNAFGDDKTSAGYKAFLQEQYNQTQKYFKDNGITHVRVYRGMEKAVEVPPQLAKAGDLQEELRQKFSAACNGQPLSSLQGEEYAKAKVFQEQYIKARGAFEVLYEENKKKNQSGKAEMLLQPISSFSTSYEVAKQFASSSHKSMIIVSVIPVEHILSTARTGFGCLSEAEVTVLAHKLDGHFLRYPQGVIGGFPSTEEKYLEKLGISSSVKDEKWITIKKGEEGKGRKLLLDDKGNIIGGDVPKSAQGKSLKEAFTELKEKVSGKSSKSSQREDSGNPLSKEEMQKEIAEKALAPLVEQGLVSYSKTAVSPLAEVLVPTNSTAPDEKQLQQMNKKLRVAMFGKDLEYASDVTQKQREEAKSKIVDSLSLRLKANEAFLAALRAEAEELGYDPSNSPDIVSMKVRALISGWATTSADSSKQALNMQRAAQELFNLTEATTAHFPIVDDIERIKRIKQDFDFREREYLSAVKKQKQENLDLEERFASGEISVQLRDKGLRYAQERVDDKWRAREEARSFFEQEMGKEQIIKSGYQSFLQAQYDETQAYFKKHGITHLTLYRGMGGVPLSERIEKDLLKNRSVVGEADLALQPISSFSTSYRTARSFGAGHETQTVVACMVPVEHILSTAKTGFGCLSEGEVTVLAHKLKGKRITQSRVGDLPQTEAEFLNAVGKLV